MAATGTSVEPGNGWFIVLEGIDGSGKSTQAGRLVRRLLDHGVPARATREPSDGPIGALIRQALSGRIAFDERVLAYLYAADRLDHITNGLDGMSQALTAGDVVVSDRYQLSTYAYHTNAFDLATVVGLNMAATDLLVPDLILFLEVSPDVAARRLASRGGGAQRYERLETLRRVRDAYAEAIPHVSDRSRVAIVDGEQPPELVAEAIWREVGTVIGGGIIGPVSDRTVSAPGQSA
nr:dTMP kinase [Micromonospora sp. DSM 115978]